MTLYSWVQDGLGNLAGPWLIRASDISLEVVAKPHEHFFNVSITQASWKKATNILI
jgi:hypothetical protein